ncbi:dihydrofolate reductase [mine drainage metagenome]|uniref:Dihydrofolate reductase n=1 Tax=mine drainage metagenome TaxID=410659 RepID=T1ACG2_9ZZZZ
MTAEPRITRDLYVTLDGVGEWPEYPGSSIWPPEADPMFTEMDASRYDSGDTVIFGRRAIEGHFTARAEAARKDGDPNFLFDRSRGLDRCNTIVLLRTLTETRWSNSRFLSDPLGDVVEPWWRGPGRDLVVDGGPSVVRELIEKGPADDRRMAVGPVIPGRGWARWPMVRNDPRTLRLVVTKTLSYGGVGPSRRRSKVSSPRPPTVR